MKKIAHSFTEYVIKASQIGQHRKTHAQRRETPADRESQWTTAITMNVKRIDAVKAILALANNVDYYSAAGVACELNKFGNLLYEQGDFDAAIVVYQKGLAIERAVLEDCHPNIIVTLKNIGQIHKIQGEYRLALRLFQEALRIQLQRECSLCSSRGDVHQANPNIAATLTTIALIYYECRNYKKALDFYQETLCICRDAYGEVNLEVASCLNSIGLVFFKLKFHKLAMESFEKSLRIRTKLLGSDHRDIASILNNIATVRLELGDDDTALIYYRETLRVERASLGTTNPDVIMTLQHVGHVHELRGELDEALQYYREALNIQMASASTIEEEVAIAQTFNVIGNVYLQRGEARHAVTYFSYSLRYLRRAGKNNQEDDYLTISGFNFYGLSKLHPECAPAA